MSQPNLPVRTGHYRAILACLILFTVVISNNFNADSNVSLSSSLTPINQNLHYLGLNQLSPSQAQHFSILTSLLQSDYLNQVLAKQNLTLSLPQLKLSQSFNLGHILTTFSVNLLHSIYIAAP